MTRQPDYFDGEKSPAIIKWLRDSATGKIVPKAIFNNGYTNYTIHAGYIFRSWKNDEKTEVIYETDHPEKAAIYTFWGYWLTWPELFATALIYLALFQIALSVTKNPTEEALKEQGTFKKEKKRKYQD